MEGAIQQVMSASQLFLGIISQSFQYKGVFDPGWRDKPSIGAILAHVSAKMLI
jgi:hypothetical protein